MYISSYIIGCLYFALENKTKTRTASLKHSEEG
jgi:hypothetical protein